MKAARSGDYLIGGAGCSREIDAGIEWLVANPDNTRDPRFTLRAMRKVILETTERSKDVVGLDSHFLLVGPRGILIMGSDGSLSDAPPRWAIGCGEDVGLGAMFRRPGSPAEVVRVAVEAACALREGCFGEAVVLDFRELPC